MSLLWVDLSEDFKYHIFINVTVVSGWSEQLPDALVDESLSVAENTEKIKKRYRKRKNKLEETFPAYLQVIFCFTFYYVVCYREKCNVLCFEK